MHTLLLHSLTGREINIAQELVQDGHAIEATTLTNDTHSIEKNNANKSSIPLNKVVFSKTNESEKCDSNNDNSEIKQNGKHLNGTSKHNGTILEQNCANNNSQSANYKESDTLHRLS